VGETLGRCRGAAEEVRVTHVTTTGFGLNVYGHTASVSSGLYAQSETYTQHFLDRFSLSFLDFSHEAQVIS
jgi:hypothetical protein